MNQAPAPRITKDAIEANVVHQEVVTHVTHSGQILRWGVITLANGFAVTGRPSAAVDPRNDTPELGERIALENAFNEIWPLMGYELRCRLHAEALATEAIAEARKAMNEDRA